VIKVKEAPSYQRIRGEIEAKILSGEWPPGSKIAPEHEVMKQYGCSRMTVSRAITGLVEAGLVVRRKRAGSFVARPKQHSVVFEIPDIEAQVLARGETYRFSLLAHAQVVADGDFVTESGFAAGTRLLMLRGVHVAAGTPFSYEQRWISLDTVESVREVDFTKVSPGKWLLEHVPWTEAENRILAVNASAQMARQLEIDEGTACLCVQRRTWRGEAGVTFVKQFFPGEVYDVVARFRPRGME